MNGIEGLYLHSGASVPLGVVRAAGQPILRRGADPRRVPVRRSWAIPENAEKRPTRAFRNSTAIPTGQAPDGYPSAFLASAKRK